MREPLLHSSLRFLSRDLTARGTDPRSSDEYWQDARKLIKRIKTIIDLGYDPGYVQTVQSGDRNLSDHWHYGGYDFDSQSGISGWSDFDGVAEAARSTLQEAAGITPPSGNFVLKLLAVYLLVLVPLNWAVFWFFGKVEYAWIAAPIIAVSRSVDRNPDGVVRHRVLAEQTRKLRY